MDHTITGEAVGVELDDFVDVAHVASTDDAVGASVGDDGGGLVGNVVVDPVGVVDSVTGYACSVTKTKNTIQWYQHAMHAPGSLQPSTIE